MKRSDCPRGLSRTWFVAGSTIFSRWCCGGLALSERPVSSSTVSAMVRYRLWHVFYWTITLKEKLFKCRGIQCYFSRVIRVALLTGMVALLICENITKADEVPAFFLKIAGIPTLPRVGRSGRYEDFFYPFKTEKHIPRIGRNSQQVAHYWNWYTWYNYADICIYLYAQATDTVRSR